MNTHRSRRDFLKDTAGLTLALTLAPLGLAEEVAATASSSTRRACAPARRKALK